MAQPKKKGAKKKEKRIVPSGRGPHSGFVQQHRRYDHRSGRKRRVLVQRRLPGVQGVAQGNSVRRAAGRLTAANRAREAGMRSLEVNVKGPGSGRDSAIRALQTAGLEIRAIRDVDADSA